MPINAKLQKLCAEAASTAATVTKFDGEKARGLDIQKRKAFLTGDAQAYWLGRVPVEGKMAEVYKAYVESAQIGPGIERLVNAVVGKDFDLQISNGDKAAEDDDPVATELKRWVTKVKLNLILKQALTWVLGLGEGFPYVYQGNSRRLEELLELTPPESPTDLTDAFNRVHAIALDGTQAGVIEDDHGQPLAFWYAYKVVVDDKEENRLEIHAPFDSALYKQEGTTLTEIETAKAPLKTRNDGKYTNFQFQLARVQLDGGGLVDASLVDDQGKHTEARTYLHRNSQTAGYRSIITVNAEGVTDSEGNAAAWTLGPNRVIELTGKAQYIGGLDAPRDIENKIMPSGYSDVGIHFVDPITPDTLIATADHFKLSILSRLDQLWIEGVTAEVSGESKKESRRGFDQRVNAYALLARDVVRHYCLTALALVGAMEGNADKYAGYDVEPKFYLDVSAGDLQLYTALVDSAEKGLVSERTLLEVNPAVYDADVEEKRLEAQQRIELAVLASEQGLEVINTQITELTSLLVQLGDNSEQAQRNAIKAVVMAAKRAQMQKQEGQNGRAGEAVNQDADSTTA